VRYDYECQACQDVFEVQRMMEDSSPVVCKCGSTKTIRVITRTPLIHVAWRNTLGLGHSGQIVMSAVDNRSVSRRNGRRRMHENPISS